MTKLLTVRGVKATLTRSSVDHSPLTITASGASVAIAGPRESRRAAFNALFDRGFSCAPYPDQDVWTRR